VSPELQSIVPIQIDCYPFGVLARVTAMIVLDRPRASGVITMSMKIFASSSFAKESLIRISARAVDNASRPSQNWWTSHPNVFLARFDGGANQLAEIQ
jgi:hypothetical protein